MTAVQRDSLALHAGLAVLVVGAAVVASAVSAKDALQWRTATAGVATCAATAVLSFAMKRRARTVNAALLAVVVVFGVRALVAVVGTFWAVRFGGGIWPFVLGFFGTYFPLQWVEISYLLAAAREKRAQ